MSHERKGSQTQGSAAKRPALGDRADSDIAKEISTWYDKKDNGIHQGMGTDRPSHITKVNVTRKDLKCLVLLSKAKPSGENPLPAPIILGFTQGLDDLEFETYFQCLQYSQDPGVRFCVRVGPNEAWAFDFRRQRMVLGSGNRVAHYILQKPFLTYGNSLAVRLRGVFNQLNLHNGTLGQYTSIMNRVASWGKSNRPKSFDILNWGYDPKDPPVCIPNFPAGERPEMISRINQQLLNYDQATVILAPSFINIARLKWHLDVLFEKWDIHQGPFWFHRSYQDRVTNEWKKIPQHELRSTPELGSGMMFSKYYDVGLPPPHEPWMGALPKGNSKNRVEDLQVSNIQYNERVYNEHPGRISYDDLDQVEHHMSLGFLYELEYIRKVWNHHCGGQTTHSMTVSACTQPALVRLDISFNKGTGILPPRLPTGWEVGIRLCDSSVSLHSFRNARVTDSYTTTEDLVLVGPKESFLDISELEEGRIFVITILAEPNLLMFTQRFLAIQQVVKTKNPTLKKLVLNQGYVKGPAMRLKAGYSNEESEDAADMMELWEPVMPMNSVPLRDSDKAIRDKYITAMQLNHEQLIH